MQNEKRAALEGLARSLAETAAQCLDSSQAIGIDLLTGSLMVVASVNKEMAKWIAVLLEKTK